MANVNLSASFLELSRRSNNPVAKDFSLGGWGGGGIVVVKRTGKK